MEKSRILRSAGLIGSLTLLSRFLGLIRDFLTAGFFGTSLAMSAFVVAFRLPNLFRALFGEGALSSALVPVFIETRKQAGDAAAWAFARKVISLVGLTLLAVVGLGVLGITFWMHRPGLEARVAMILPLARIMLPYMLFICLAALAMAILNSYHRFALPAATPSLLNIVWIAFVLLVCPRLGTTLEEQVYGLAWGVLAAGLAQLAVQIPALRRQGYRFGFSLHWNDPRVLKVFVLMGPAALGLAVTQVNVMVNSLLAAWIGAWAPAALFYAERLLYFPQGILATAMSTVLLPVFSGQAARAEHREIGATLNHALRSLFFVMAPAALGLLVLARPIVEMIFQWNQFTARSTDLTAVALQFYAPGLLVFVLAKVFVPAFYAVQDTRTPVRIGLACVALNFTLNVIFILTWPLYLKHAGLALATVISEGFNGLALAWCFHRRFGSPGWRSLLGGAARALAAAALMALVVLAAHAGLVALLAETAAPVKLVQIAAVLGSIAIGMGSYLLVGWAARFPELQFVIEAVRRRRAGRPAEVSPTPGGPD